MQDTPSKPSSRVGRRRFLMATGALGVAAGGAFVFRRKLRTLVSRWTRRPEFAATPPLLPHDPERDRATIAVARDRSPAENVDRALDALGGPEAFIGEEDVVLVKVNAQWWNQGMTNVAGARRVIERLLARKNFKGEIIVFENVHFRLQDGSGLSRAWTRPSDRNVDVEGWSCLGDLRQYPPFRDGPVSFVGLVDAGGSELSGDAWRDPKHEHGTYGGDERGPVPDGDARDGYRWSLDEAFTLERSWVDSARAPLSWPRFTSPHSGLVVDLRDGVFRREGDRLVAADKPLKWIVLSGANEHDATGITGACKSLMGVVDMTAGRLGTHPSIREYESVHFFGSPDAMWRMAGPLVHFTQKVRRPDLYVAIAEWVAAAPPEGLPEGADPRLEEASAHHTRTVVAGTDPVAIDCWCVRNLLMPIGGADHARYDLDSETSLATAFLRYWREVDGRGTMDLDLIDVV